MRLHVAGDHEEGVIQKAGSVLDTASGAQGPAFLKILQLDAPGCTVGKVLLNGFWEVIGRNRNILKPMAAEELDDILHHRPVSYRHHGLGKITSQWAQTASLAAGHDHSLHGTLPSSASVCSSVKAGSPLALAEMEAYSREEVK